MGLPSQPLNARPHLPVRRGIALPIAILALVAMAAIPAALLSIAWARGATERNRSDSELALQIAEAGLAHAVGVISAPELKNLTFTQMLQGRTSATAGLLVGHTGLKAADEIPATGRFFTDGGSFLTAAAMGANRRLGSYKVRLVNDPVDLAMGSPLTDLNNRVVIECTGETLAGSRATVNLIWTRISSVTLSVATGGDLDIEGANNQFTSKCKGVYVGGQLTVNGSLQDGADMVWMVVGGFKQGNYSSKGTLITGPQAALSLPVLSNTLANCPIGAYGPGNLPAGVTLTNGSLGSSASRRDYSSLPNGFYCIPGNVYLTGSSKKGSTITIIAGGHISIMGTVSINHAYGNSSADNTALLAGGDIHIDGDVNIGGSVYCASQFDVYGLDINGGQLVCRDDPDPPPSVVGCANTSNPCMLSLSLAGVAGTGGNVPGTSFLRKAPGGSKTELRNSFNFPCQAKYVRPGYDLSRVAWYPTFGS